MTVRRKGPVERATYRELRREDKHTTALGIWALTLAAAIDGPTEDTVPATVTCPGCAETHDARVTVPVLLGRAQQDAGRELRMTLRQIYATEVGGAGEPNIGSLGTPE